ncbi:MAG: hypothetical protein Q4A34_03760 [Candidatus Saccharibacteria bacterium]|nr:hypothetical protein [Candidatus Saccharibacteria bacterium]
MQPGDSKKNRHTGLIVAVIVLAAALVALIGYAVIEKTVLQEEAKSRRVTTESGSEQKTPNTGAAESEAQQPAESEGAASSYVDYRTGGDGTGRKLAGSGDVDAIAGSSKLKAYLKTKAGVEVEDPVSETKVTLTPIVDRVDGSYAAVFGLTNAYVIVGPKDGGGEIDIVASSQSAGMSCSDLRKAKVPGSLVDNKCTDASGVVPYAP